jgi:hypothetical protein
MENDMAAAPSRIVSRIESVKIYHSGATVYRVAELTSVDGRLPVEIEVQGLPLSLVDATVRVRVPEVEPAGADLTAGDVRVGLHALTAPAAAEDADREELKTVGRKLLRVELLLRHVELESGFLSGIHVPERPQGEEGKPPPASPTASRVLLEQFVDEGLRARLQEARQLRQQAKELRERTVELQDRIARASSARQARPDELRKTVLVRLIAGERPPTRARVVIEYFVPGVCWAPAYQCRLSRDCRQAELQLRAVVAQRSGEDWRGVRLSLSTASALSWSEIPELTSVRIGRSQPMLPARRGFRPPPQGAGALFADYDRERHSVLGLVPPAPRWQAPCLGAEPPGMMAELPPPQSRVDDFAPQASYAGMAMSRSEADEETTESRVRAARDLAMPCEAAPECERSYAPVPACAPAPQSSPSPRRAAPRPGAPPPPPAAAYKKSKAAAVRDRRITEANAGALADEQSLGGPSLALAAVLFSQLRLCGADRPDERGRLQPLDDRSSYLELLARQQLQVDFDPLEVINLAQRAAAAVGSLPLPDGASDVRHSAGRFDFCYQADAPVDLESDGSFHSLPLQTLQAGSEVRYIVVPREEAAAYRMATLKNPLAAPLLPGPVEVHVGGDYVLTTGLPLVGRGGEFQLGLGVEQAIKVARNTEFNEVRSGTKVVAMTELHHRLRVDLHNHTDREIVCEVRERIPQPAEEAEVVVEEAEVDPPWEAYKQAERGREVQGGRRWQVSIEAGKPRTLKAAYVVKIYAQNELCGGNRREA